MINDMYNGQYHVQGLLSSIFVNVVYSGQCSIAFTKVKIMYTDQ